MGEPSCFAGLDLRLPEEQKTSEGQRADGKDPDVANRDDPGEGASERHGDGERVEPGADVLHLG